MSTIRVDQIYPVAEYGRPKGFVPYVPKGESKTHIERIQEIVAMLRRQDVRPVGPRQIGYRLKEAFRDEYVKKNKPGETLTSFSHGGAPGGTRFWCTFSPATPDGNRCIMQGRSHSARTMPSPTET